MGEENGQNSTDDLSKVADEPIPPDRPAQNANAGRKSSKKTASARVGGIKTPKHKASSQPKRTELVDAGNAKFPRHSVEKALRVPRAIIDQNAGRECSERESAGFAGVGYNGPYRVELSSAIKYGFLERPKPAHVTVTERARQALRPQSPGDEIAALRAAVLDAPDISDVYKHYRGENVPDGKFFDNALVDKFNIPAAKIAEFKEVFFSSLKAAHLIEQRGDKQRILDIGEQPAFRGETKGASAVAAEAPKLSATADTCFVIMPFSDPIGAYFQTIYDPAIRKAGLRPIRADADIFGTGKIIDQIWSGINAAKLLVAELTSRNANVFYELGLAHALQKPVVLVSSNEEDVPFDLKHIRVIYYDMTDPFWGSKLIDKISENIKSAIENPEDAIFKRALDQP